MQEELSKYISHARQTGVPDDKIRDQLTSVGWNLADVQAALAVSSRTPGGHEPAVPAASQPMPERNPHETYLYFVSLASLYFLVTALGAVLFQLMNKWIGDPGESIWSEFSKQYRDGAIRGGIASMIVFLPFYLFHWLKIGAEVARNTFRHGSKVRARWLHVTIFFAVIVLMFDLVALVTGIMNGELSGRPIAKIAIVFVLAAAVIAYHVFLLMQDRKVTAGQGAAVTDSLFFRAVFAAFLVVSVGVVAGLGLANAGTPVTASQMRNDDRRLADLRQIQLALELYADDNQQAYPDTIAQLSVVGSSGRKYIAKLPKDPKTSADYEYQKTTAGGYERCANFETDKSQEENSYPYYGSQSEDIYRHGKGRACLKGEPPRQYPTNEGFPTQNPFIR